MMRFAVLGAAALTLASASTLSAQGPGSSHKATAAGLRASLPVTARHEGVWRGTFRRFDPDGTLVETFPTEITIVFPASGPVHYEQTNRYMPPGKPERVIKTQGVFDGDRIRFENQRVRGWAVDDRSDEFKRSVLLFIQNLDGSGYIYETIQISDDGRQRHRVAQYFDQRGSLLRRTLIDETRDTIGVKK